MNMKPTLINGFAILASLTACTDPIDGYYTTMGGGSVAAVTKSDQRGEPQSDDAQENPVIDTHRGPREEIVIQAETAEQLTEETTLIASVEEVTEQSEPVMSSEADNSELPPDAPAQIDTSEVAAETANSDASIPSDVTEPSTVPSTEPATELAAPIESEVDAVSANTPEESQDDEAVREPALSNSNEDIIAVDAVEAAPASDVITQTKKSKKAKKAKKEKKPKQDDSFKKIGKNGIIDNIRDLSLPKKKQKKDSKGYKEHGYWNQSVLRGWNGTVVRESTSPKASVTYTAHLKHSGLMCVSIFRALNESGVDRAIVTIQQGRKNDLLAEQTIDLSDKSIYSGWMDIATVDLENEHKVIVELSRDPHGNNGGLLRADAIRFKSGKCSRR